MDTYLTLSTLNDFIFCPKSIYYHGLYQKYHTSLYQKKPQKKGTYHHKAIDDQTYTTSLDYLVGISVYSHSERLCGKIDLYHKPTHTLIERKTTIKTIYDGYKYQLYGQALCLKEMGYPTHSLKLISITTNKQFKLDYPNADDMAKFYQLLDKIRHYRPQDRVSTSINKCQNCIYNQLCDQYTEPSSC